MRLVELAASISAVDTGANIIGVLEEGVLIDSGANERQAKSIAKLVKVPVKCIIHTHTHADHIGGTAWFQAEQGAEAYVQPGELSFAVQPELEGALLFGGLSPAELRAPFIMAQTSDASPLSAQVLEICGLTSIATPGHSPVHTSFLKNGVFFVGDALFTPEVTEKHKILYLYDAGKAYASLDFIDNTDYDTAVLCHYGIYTKEEAVKFAQAQREHMEAIRSHLLEFAENISAEEICAKLAARLDIAPNAASWYLALSTVKGYLAWMQADGLVAASYDNGLKWGRYKVDINNP